jgi:hypothetical protein
MLFRKKKERNNLHNVSLYGYINDDHHYLSLVKRSFSDSSSGDDKDLTKNLLGTDSSISSKKKRNPGKRKKDLDSSKVMEEVKKKPSKKVKKEKPSLDDSSNLTGKPQKLENILISPLFKYRVPPSYKRLRPEKDGDIDYYGKLDENSSYVDVYKYYRNFCDYDLIEIDRRFDEDNKKAENVKLIEHNDYRLTVILDIMNDRFYKKNIVELPQHRRAKCNLLNEEYRRNSYFYSRYYAEFSQIKNYILLKEKKKLKVELLNESIGCFDKYDFSLKIEVINDVMADRRDGYIC